MTEYIDKQAAIEAIDESLKRVFVLPVGKSIMDKIPAADVRPVVMCRDCIHYEMGACLKIYDDGAANKDAWQERKPDDFCSYSEKREES